MFSEHFSIVFRSKIQFLYSDVKKILSFSSVKIEDLYIMHKLSKKATFSIVS